MPAHQSAAQGASASRAGFTLLELLVVVTILLVMTSLGAVGLTSRIPEMKMATQVSTIVKTIQTARERAIAEKRTWKVRFHQTRRADSADELFKRDSYSATAPTYGTHQFVFSAPVEAWFSAAPTIDISPTALFPTPLKELASGNYDDGLPVGVQIYPMLLLTDASAITTTLAGTEFPKELASLRMPGTIELEPEIRVLQINGQSTFTGPLSGACSNCYGDSPYIYPVPDLPNTNTLDTNNPPRPLASGTYNTFDDRIADITYTPDGVFRYNPVHSAGANISMTFLLGNYEAAALGVLDSRATTAIIDVDIKTGMAKQR